MAPPGNFYRRNPELLSAAHIRASVQYERQHVIPDPIGLRDIKESATADVMEAIARRADDGRLPTKNSGAVAEELRSGRVPCRNPPRSPRSVGLSYAGWTLRSNRQGEVGSTVLSWHTASPSMAVLGRPRGCSLDGGSGRTPFCHGSRPTLPLTGHDGRAALLSLTRQRHDGSSAELVRRRHGRRGGGRRLPLPDPGPTCKGHRGADRARGVLRARV